MQSTALTLYHNPLIQSALSNGEYLSYARYAKYIPGAPSVLKSPITSWVGDTCRVANATMGIGAKVSTLLNPHTSVDKKLGVLIGIAQNILNISNTHYGECLPSILPKNICNTINMGYKTAKTGLASKGLISGPSLNDKIEAVRLGTVSANTALSLVGYGFFSPIRLSLGAGYCALTAAKMVTSTAQFFGNLLRACSKSSIG
jgi:hypothetical protein